MSFYDVTTVLKGRHFNFTCEKFPSVSKPKMNLRKQILFLISIQGTGVQVVVGPFPTVCKDVISCNASLEGFVSECCKSKSCCVNSAASVTLSRRFNGFDDCRLCGEKEGVCCPPAYCCAPEWFLTGMIAAFVCLTVLVLLLVVVIGYSCGLCSHHVQTKMAPTDELERDDDEMEREPKRKRFSNQVSNRKSADELDRDDEMEREPKRKRFSIQVFDRRSADDGSSVQAQSDVTQEAESVFDREYRRTKLSRQLSKMGLLRSKRKKSFKSGKSIRKVEE